VEIAKQHRLGVEAMYFPAIGWQFENLHFNKHPGEVLTAPIVGKTVAVNIITKDQTAFAFSAAQPVTPFFTIYQVAKVARADENIARAKAGMPMVEVASTVEKNFFDLLVAQPDLTSTEARAKQIEAKWLTASDSGAPIISVAQ
jgi:hypothetical protein